MLKYLLVFFTLLIIGACTTQPTDREIKDKELMQPSQPDTVLLRYKEGDNLIEERRVKGFLYSLKVIPKQGKPYYLIDASGDNQTLQHNRPKQKIPSWTLFKW